jgi:Mlc titration factor MtfA (ptsG expression regulator)
MLNWLRRKRRAELRRRPFPQAWQSIIERNVPYVGRLTPQDMEELLGHVQVFLSEKRFEGCGGMTITDDVRVTIAAQACVLLLHREATYYPRLVSILVYPTTFLTPGGSVEGGLETDALEPALGESWARDVLVLAWDSVLSGAADMHDGQNLVLHEFAHQLDQEDGVADGAPMLPRRSMYVAWARVLGDEYEQLVRETRLEQKSLMDHYGATNPAEFFAVATETFFEMPRQLRSRHPKLYQQLAEFYRQDPAATSTEGATPNSRG